MTRLVCLGLAVLAGCSATAAVADPAAPALSAKSIVWNLEKVHGDRIGPTSVSWVDAAGHVVWTKPLPEPLRFSVNNDGNATTWLTAQRDNGYARYWAVVPLSAASAIAIADEGELWIVDVKDGHTRFEWTDKRSRDERGDTFSEAMFDTGTVEIGGPKKEQCTFSEQRQSLLEPCGSALIYFDHGILAVFDTATFALTAKTDLHGPGFQDLKGRCPGDLKANVDKTVTLAGWKIRFHGVRETVCED